MPGYSIYPGIYKSLKFALFWFAPTCTPRDIEKSQNTATVKAIFLSCVVKYYYMAISHNTAYISSHSRKGKARSGPPFQGHFRMSGPSPGGCPGPRPCHQNMACHDLNQSELGRAWSACLRWSSKFATARSIQPAGAWELCPSLSTDIYSTLFVT